MKYSFYCTYLILGVYFTKSCVYFILRDRYEIKTLIWKNEFYVFLWIRPSFRGTDICLIEKNLNFSHSAL